LPISGSSTRRHEALFVRRDSTAITFAARFEQRELKHEPVRIVTLEPKVV
jgi:hypothetical protein